MRHAKTTPTHSGASSARPHRARRILGTLMIAAGLALLVAAGFTWGKAQWRYHKQDQINRKLASYVTLYDAPSNAPKPPDVDWAGLKAVNTDVVAWLQVPGTAVNYPVYQAEDNVRYLRSSVTGEYAVVSRSDAAQVIAGTKHVLALITCNYYEAYGRTVLLCVPKAEAAAALS